LCSYKENAIFSVSKKYEYRLTNPGSTCIYYLRFEGECNLFGGWRREEKYFLECCRFRVRFKSFIHLPCVRYSFIEDINSWLRTCSVFSVNPPRGHRTLNDITMDRHNWGKRKIKILIKGNIGLGKC